MVKYSIIYPYIYNMGKRLLVIIVLFLCSLGSLQATHIVGGEFELVHLDNFNYRLNLVLYFDQVNGNPGAEDQQVVPYIFRTSDNLFMDSVVLFNSGSQFVPYSQPNCAIGDLITRRILYTTVITLSPDRYSDPEGFYVTWERCCRNNFVNNIDYQGGINTVGQTFFLQFPPVTVDGRQFINSTPVLFPPLRDYGCVGKPFFTEFGGTDLDGDSLTYTLIDPLDSSSDLAFPVITSAPYAPIPWALGIDVENMVPGTPALRVNDKGLITVTPSTRGLFVFALKVEEFREGVKIGEVRRDFQMLVIDGCDFSTPPEVFATPKDSDQRLSITDTVRFRFDEDKCLDLFVTDMDPDEVITFRAIPVNFEGELAGIFEFPTGITANFQDTLKVEVCLPDCPPDASGLMVVDLLAMDDACAVPLIDTTRLVFVIEPPPNNDPVIDPDVVTHVISTEQELYELVINATDLDDDALILDIIPVGFSLEDYGMSFTEILNNPGALSTLFTWDADCRRFDFANRNIFNLLVLVDDEDDCKFGNADTLQLNLVFELPPNNKPVVTIPDAVNNSITVDVNNPIDISILGFDPDNDSIFLSLFNDEGSSGLPPGVTFIGSEGVGNVSSSFVWTPGCDEIAANDGGTFLFKFLVGDNSCLNAALDTVELEVIVEDGEFSLDAVDPKNVFTPLNDDGFNPVFFVDDLPEGNCQNVFEGVTIVNRWGKQVYEADSRDFRWDGSGVAPGVYYFLIKYSNSEIRGYVSVLDASKGSQ